MAPISPSRDHNVQRGGLTGWDPGCLGIVAAGFVLALFGFMIAASSALVAAYAISLYLGLKRGRFGLILGVDGTRRKRPIAFWIVALLFALLTAGGVTQIVYLQSGGQ